MGTNINWSFLVTEMSLAFSYLLVSIIHQSLLCLFLANSLLF